MDEMHEAATVAVKACRACSAGLLEHDNFCRWCGAAQAARPLIDTAGHCGSTSPYTTSTLEELGASPYRPVSGPLVEAMVAGVSSNPSTHLYSRGARGLIRALVSIPIWLMIVLLSPLDAYAAAKSISRES